MIYYGISLQVADHIYVNIGTEKLYYVYVYICVGVWAHECSAHEAQKKVQLPWSWSYR